MSVTKFSNLSECFFINHVYRNSDVQVVALQNGVVDQLHSFLKASMDEQDSLEFTTLLSGGVSTLSALLRNFPVAQKQFFSTSVMSPSGFELLAKLSRLNVTNGIRGLRVRILTLLTDLYSERVCSFLCLNCIHVITSDILFNI